MKDARQLLVENSKELGRFVKTDQYKLSRELMKERYKQSKSEKELSKGLGISEEKYIGLECGDEEVSKEEYEDVVRRARCLRR